MSFLSLSQSCTLKVLSKELLNNSKEFDCDNYDLNNFFTNDSLKYAKELLGKSYCFVLNDDPQNIVCAFTVSNDSIKTSYLPSKKKNQLNRAIPNQKRFRSYPAVLIGRLGVNKNYQNLKVGSQLMNFIKAWFIDPSNKTGCRFIVVDAYASTTALRYYKSNQFEFLFDNEAEEKDFLMLSIEKELNSRLMYFDLKSLVNS